MRTPVIFLGNNCKSTVISASAKELKNHQRELGKHVSYVRLALLWRKTGHCVAGACKIDFETFVLRLARCAALGRSTRAKNLRCAKSSDFALFCDLCSGFPKPYGIVGNRYTKIEREQFLDQKRFCGKLMCWRNQSSAKPQAALAAEYKQ